MVNIDIGNYDNEYYGIDGWMDGHNGYIQRFYNTYCIET